MSGLFKARALSVPVGCYKRHALSIKTGGIGQSVEFVPSTLMHCAIRCHNFHKYQEGVLPMKVGQDEIWKILVCLNFQSQGI
ncbi:hypothetical protein AS593_06375 [Caulobacter vibrioides]|nr:hypothetical protein AS593_06375 [Caulobacter vibrioides]